MSKAQDTDFGRNHPILLLNYRMLYGPQSASINLTEKLLPGQAGFDLTVSQSQGQRDDL